MKKKAASMPFPSLHQDFGEVKFFQALSKCLRMTGLPDFSLRDLHVPTAKRLRHQLSAVINFAKFREEQFKVYAELNKQVCIL
jgi:kinetochore protein Nuf2